MFFCSNLGSLLLIVVYLCQTCVKYCSQAERDAVFVELKPHFLTFACNTYAVHLIKKMLDNGKFMLIESC